MADNTVTFILDGSVPLDSFAKGVSAFSELVFALSENVSKTPVRWVINDLQFSSAMATASGEGNTLDIGNVVAAYVNVGLSLVNKSPIGYGNKVARAANRIFDIGVERVRFETATREAIIPLRQVAILESLESPSHGLELVRNRKPAFGGIRGRIQTLSSRGGLRFTLFDIHQDKAVSCYFEEGKQNIVRDLWGRLAIVEGVVTRDPITGRPLTIREVNEITPFSEPSQNQDYELALGVSPSKSGMSAEEAIRRIRDAQ